MRSTQCKTAKEAEVLKAQSTGRDFIIRFVVFALVYAAVGIIDLFAATAPVSIRFALFALVLGYAFSQNRGGLQTK